MKKNDATRSRTQHSTQELVRMAIDDVNNWITKGVCPQCAITVTATLKQCDPNKLLDLWIEHKAQELNSETALD